MTPRSRTALVAGLALLIGFAAAQVTDLRWLGGLVVVAGAAWCVARGWRRTTRGRLALLLVTGAACFVLAHLLAESLGPWPSVLLSALVLAAATYLLVEERRRPTELRGRWGRPV